MTTTKVIRIDSFQHLCIMRMRNHDIVWYVITRSTKSYSYASTKGYPRVIGKHYRVKTCEHAMINHYEKQNNHRIQHQLSCMSKTGYGNRKREEPHYQEPSSRGNQQ